jgi:protein TonB
VGTGRNPCAGPIYRINPEPAYPASGRRRRQEGLVLFNVTVTAQGRASRVDVKQSSGVPALDDAAREAVRGWEFEPGRVGLLPVESEIEVPVRFKLQP